MDIKVTKPIIETKYLSVENSWRYRSIMRLFYIFDSRYRHWLNKEDVFQELKKHQMFEEYTIEQCSQDLEALTGYGNLTAVQDTGKVATYKQFMNKQYRYRMTEYSIEIERMTLRLENIHIEGGSLDPTLLERIKEEIKKLYTIDAIDDKELGRWWTQLTHDFQILNQKYQDYIRDWTGTKAEELMKTNNFLLYKEKLVEYLRNFVKELQLHGSSIEKVFKDIDKSTITHMIDRITDVEMDIPRVDFESLTRQDMRANIVGKYESIEGFFINGISGESELEIILSMTNEIIRKITRYAAGILESSSQYSGRKEEYLKVCQLFADTKSLDEAHKLSAMVFGISGYKHFVGEFERETENIYSSVYEESPYEVVITPRVRTYREKMVKTSIKDNRELKHAMRQAVLEERKREEEIILSYMEHGMIGIENLGVIPEHARKTIMRWISRGFHEKGEPTTTEHGKKYRLINPSEKKRCKLESEDGVLELPAYILKFEE